MVPAQGSPYYWRNSIDINYLSRIADHGSLDFPYSITKVFTWKSMAESFFLSSSSVIGIISTYKHRIEELVTEEEDKKKELQHVREALKRCWHPNWSSWRDRRRRKEPKLKPKRKKKRRGKSYIKGLSEKLARVYRKYDIERYTNQQEHYATRWRTRSTN